MNISNEYYPGFLDELRHTQGIDKLKSYFHELMAENPEKAARLINDPQLQYCSLFALQSELQSRQLVITLNTRNQEALTITREISAKSFSSSQHASYERSELTHSVLKWILNTGCKDDGFSKQYDEIVDTCAIYLARKFKDRQALHIISQMIFDRHRKGAYIYDLIWAFFEACDPYSLTLLANGLRSSGYKDVELARKLLGFIPCVHINTNDGMQLYSCTLFWLQENCMFLHYTGEGFQKTANPIPYIVSFHAKYLCKPIWADSGKFVYPLSEYERALIDNFKTLDNTAKALLSNYSFRLYRQNQALWHTWLRYPLTLQLSIASSNSGGVI